MYFHNYLEAEKQNATNKKINELEGKIIEWLKNQEKKTHKTDEIFKEFEEKGRGGRKINKSHIREALHDLNDVGFIVWEKGTITFVETLKQSTITDPKSN